MNPSKMNTRVKNSLGNEINKGMNEWNKQRGLWYRDGMGGGGEYQKKQHLSGNRDQIVKSENDQVTKNVKGNGKSRECSRERKEAKEKKDTEKQKNQRKTK